MCGIVGRLSWDQTCQPGTVRAMAAALVHRGPDHGGLWSDGVMTMGHRRLSVIDLAPASHQPMADASGQIHIVFNGEIYNYKEIRADLERLGVRLRTQSDTEVILEAYKQWGVEAVSRFNGMFAIALWDAPRQRLILVRDRLGKKPLFYRLHKDGLSFASEIKALAADKEFERSVNCRAVGHLLQLGYILGSEAIWRGVEKLPPAHILTIERDRPPKLTRYWNLLDSFGDKASFASEDEAAEQLEALLQDAVRLRMVSDVPLGAFLSGGLDSSAIVACMAGAMPADNILTFSAGFDEHGYDERQYARLMAEHVGCRFFEETITADIGREFPRTAWYVDEPFADNSLFPMFALSRFARQQITVVLSGDGGDELFGGYETYVADKIHRATSVVPAVIWRACLAGLDRLPASWAKVGLQFKMKQFARAQGQDDISAHFGWRRIFSPQEIRALVKPEYAAALLEADPVDEFRRLHAEAKDFALLDRMSYVDINTWLVDDILVKLDRTTMAFGLEARAPFLDYRVVEFAARLPPSLKLKGFTKKYLLRQAMKKHLPPSLIKRPKRGFNAPVAAWLEPGNGLFSHLSVDDLAGEYFRADAIADLLGRHRSRREDASFKLMVLCALAMWYKAVHQQTRPEEAQ
jgi:asparagine synthase (glutamine-hydrolysing)